MVAVVALLAGASPDEGSSEDETPKDVRDEAPIFAYTYAPLRASAGSFGGQAYGEVPRRGFMLGALGVGWTAVASVGATTL